jgi:hypothetical protein
LNFTSARPEEKSDRRSIKKTAAEEDQNEEGRRVFARSPEEDHWEENGISNRQFSATFSSPVTKMNRQAFKLAAYLTSIAFFVAFVALALLDSSHRLSWLAAASASLCGGWAVERLFSRREKQGERKREVHSVGQFDVENSLSFSDQLDLSNCTNVEDIPKGTYSAEVEILYDGRSSYVASLVLTGRTKSQSPKEEMLSIVVDTGFLIVTGVQRTADLLRGVKEAQAKILEDNEREVDVEVIMIGQRSVGLIASTGYGDDEYSLVFGTDSYGNLRVLCRFIE